MVNRALTIPLRRCQPDWISSAARLTGRTRAATHIVVMPADPGRASEAVALVGRIAQGDRDAFSRFYDAFAGLALGTIRRILRDPGSSEEVLQEVFWQIWREAPNYDPHRGSPEAWLLMCARTRAIDKLRSIRRREKTFVAPVDDAVARPAGVERERTGAVAEDRGVLAPALAQLPAAQRAVIELAFFEGLTQAEIAARLGEPLGTVKTRARLGLERLRSALKEQGLPAT